ncbi:beta-ketoacyl-[acyl-carrier-protein] synthase II [bacterium NHP-B]|nr:beta-ketoacyl-[acyl-carrier-protein] synthase II [bacterium NHP-B]
MRRVVVTGMGAVCPLGSGVSFVWDRLVAGASGIVPIHTFPTEDLSCKIAGLVPHGTAPGELDFEGMFSPAERKRNDRFIPYALAASDEAVKDAGLVLEDERLQERSGVLIGSGIGGLGYIYDTSVALHEGGPRRVSPFFIPSCLINLATGQVSIRHKMKGPNQAVVTACATGTHAIGDGARLIADDKADVMLVGGAEAAVCYLGVAGFASMRALSTGFNDRPQAASRPWDKDRDGFVMGEGAGLLVLEELEHAKARGAKIYGEVKGYGLSGDAYHIAAPDGKGAVRAMQEAIEEAGIDHEQVGYINAHGTSTPQGDKAELEAIHKVFGSHTSRLSVSSTKSSIGHLLGAAGGVEAIFTMMALKTGVLPPTLNLDHCSEETDIDLVPHRAKEKKISWAVSNSFGFGGTNASLVMRRWDD